VIAPLVLCAILTLAQDRSVSVDIADSSFVWTSGLPGFDPPDSSTTEFFSDSSVAPDFSPFSAVASVVEFQSTSAAQDSSIGSTQIRATGSHAAIAGIISDFVAPPPFTQDAEQHDTATSFSATFSLDEECDYDLSGSVSTVGTFASTSTSFIRLSGPGAVVIAELQLDSDPSCIDPECVEQGPELLTASGNLAAGVYTLEAVASGTANGFYSNLSGDVSVPEGGDFDLTLQVATPVPGLPLWGRSVLAVLLGLPLLRFVAPWREGRTPCRRASSPASRSSCTTPGSRSSPSTNPIG